MRELPGSWDKPEHTDPPEGDAAADRVPGCVVSPDDVANEAASSAADIRRFREQHAAFLADGEEPVDASTNHAAAVTEAGRQTPTDWLMEDFETRGDPDRPRSIDDSEEPSDDSERPYAPMVASMLDESRRQAIHDAAITAIREAEDLRRSSDYLLKGYVSSVMEVARTQDTKGLLVEMSSTGLRLLRQTIRRAIQDMRGTNEQPDPDDPTPRP